MKCPINNSALNGMLLEAQNKKIPIDGDLWGKGTNIKPFKHWN